MGTLASYLEPALTIGSGAAAQPLSGLWGLINGLDADAVKRAQAAMTFMPYTDGGKKNLQRLGGLLADAKETMVDRNPPVKMAVDAYNGATDYVGEMSPAMGAIMKTLPTAAGMVAGPTGRAVDSAMLAAGKRVAPVANKVGDKLAAAMKERGGLSAQLAQDLTQGTTSNIWLPNRPSNPNPLVGNRYKVQDIGGLVPHKQVTIEDLYGSSILMNPWDSTSRNRLIHGVSDVDFIDPVLTTGGDAYARDVKHVANNIGGASGEQIANRVQDRVVVAADENLKAGGNGNVIIAPNTMARYGEDFSNQKTEALNQLLMKAGLTKKQMRVLDDSIKQYTPPGSEIERPFRNYGGLLSDYGDFQRFTGDGILGPGAASELRKAIANRLRLEDAQKMIGYNTEDLENALKDPRLIGVPNNWAGDTLIKADPNGFITPSNNVDYSHNFPGTYFGTFGRSMPMKVLAPDVWDQLGAEFHGKKGNMDSHIALAVGKRKAQISQIVNDRTVDSVNKWLKANPGN